MLGGFDEWDTFKITVHGKYTTNNLKMNRVILSFELQYAVVESMSKVLNATHI